MHFSVILIPILLTVQGSYSWRLLSHDSSNSGRCNGGGIFIVGFGTSNCLLVDRPASGLMIQSTLGDDPRGEFWAGPGGCRGRPTGTINSRDCIDARQFMFLKIVTAPHVVGQNNNTVTAVNCDECPINNVQCGE